MLESVVCPTLFGCTLLERRGALLECRFCDQRVPKPLIFHSQIYDMPELLASLPNPGSSMTDQAWETQCQSIQVFTAIRLWLYCILKLYHDTGLKLVGSTFVVDRVHAVGSG